MPIGGGLKETAHPKKKAGIHVPKLIQNDKSNIFYRFINYGYGFGFLIWNFGKKLLWFGSCVTFMFFLPMGFEIFVEQSRILQKIQLQMMNDSSMMGPGDMQQPTIRPF